jgi:hypothetical protein
MAKDFRDQVGDHITYISKVFSKVFEQLLYGRAVLGRSCFLKVAHPCVAFPVSREFQP